jgi:hypothetical protein
VLQLLLFCIALISSFVAIVVCDQSDQFRHACGFAASATSSHGQESEMGIAFPSGEHSVLKRNCVDFIAELDGARCRIVLVAWILDTKGPI